jgi:hypothetical protein
MITRDEYVNLDSEIKQSIETTFDYLIKNHLPDFILFLADAELDTTSKKSNLKINPYAIEDGVDDFKDETRLVFLSQFLTNYYSFPYSQKFIDNDQYRLQLELMIYCHIWESKPFLKKLRRIASLINGESYLWEVEIPPTTKYEFIRDNIRLIIKDQNNNLSEIIFKGFHSTLRNAFAHSEYSFDTMNNHNRINLYNYSGKNWDINHISFDDWSKRFLYSVLLSYHLMRITDSYKKEIIEKTGKDTFEINYPSQSKKMRNQKIIYSKKNNSFHFEK